MARPARFELVRWLGDKRRMRVHDADNLMAECRIDELMESEQFTSFGPDSLAEARNRGYRPCPYCVRDEAA